MRDSGLASSTSSRLLDPLDTASHIAFSKANFLLCSCDSAPAFVNRGVLLYYQRLVAQVAQVAQVVCSLFSAYGWVRAQSGITLPVVCKGITEVGIAILYQSGSLSANSD